MRYPEKDHRQYTTVVTQPPLPSPALAETVLPASEIAHVDRQNDSKSVAAIDIINVLLVDAQILLLEGLRQLFALEPDIQVVGEAVNGIEAMQKIRQLQPDVVLMDIHIPGVDGIALTRQIAHEFPQTAVIILTTQGQPQQMVQTLKQGAKGYVLKNISVHELTHAIRAVHTGEIYIKPAWTGALVGELRRLSSVVTGELEMPALSEKELEIIRYVAAGMSNREIATALAYSEKTVKNYLSVIFQKLHLRDRTQVAIFALRQGLLPAGEL